MAVGRMGFRVGGGGGGARPPFGGKGWCFLYDKNGIKTKQTPILFNLTLKDDPLHFQRPT